MGDNLTPMDFDLPVEDDFDPGGVFKDFDADVEFEDVPPIRFKLNGETYEAPGEVPAGVVLLAMRGELDLKKMDTIYQILELTLGKEGMERMIRSGVTSKRFYKVVTWLMMEQYGFEEQDVAEGESEDSPLAQNESSGIGPSSEATSSGTTKSGSP